MLLTTSFICLADVPLVQSGKTRNVLDNKSGEHDVVAMEMSEKTEPSKQTVLVEVISSKELVSVTVNAKNVSFLHFYFNSLISYL